MKIRYSIIEKLHNLSSSEMNLFLYAARFQNQATGIVEGVYYRDVIKHTGMCKQSFYNALKGLEEKNIITVTKASDLDYDICILDNACATEEEWREGYVNLNRKVFHSKQFRTLKAHEKYLLLDFMKGTHENGHSMHIGVERLYKKYGDLLKVTKRVIRDYLHTLHSFFTFYTKEKKYYITYRHSVFNARNEKSEAKWYQEFLVKKECHRQHTNYDENTLADTAILINQYQNCESSLRKRIEIVIRCIAKSVEDIRHCERTLQPKYIHKLVRIELGLDKQQNEENLETV